MIINIQGEMTESKMLSVMEDIEKGVEAGKVTIQLCSGGGDISAAMMLYYYLEEKKEGLIEIKVVNHVASACTLLLLTKHRTIAYPHVSFMFHPTTTSVSYNELCREAVLDNCTQRIEHYWGIFVSAIGQEKVDVIRTSQVYYYVQDLASWGLLANEQ